ncbi:type III PLP-dependent enzyme [Psychrosphaera sp. B3R10]|uniref:type III PLP-dependent enzyme n=1 Tax=unclassified Psychrosphaera TaxID=2641570 RepID=UPI001C089A41|nr:MULTISPECIES: type III PLP-dependent enzyme [unclassified Psychrosphaera]MBU2883052.1 type III PLP-dependent enzyme [Psychrosphaera sp. I2R16]MBU2988509.1 type III PLP-dependent enzyme [Psychrosphaera sp. B3R10]
MSINPIVTPIHAQSLSFNHVDSAEVLVAQYGAPLMVLDCDVVRQQYRSLQQALPNVDLHYALKPLPHPAVVSALLAEGAYFDLATNGEVDLVNSVGVPSDRTIQTHPIKRVSDIQYALEYGCCVFVVDNINEIDKFVAFKDDVELLVRVSFPNADVLADLSKKFGCKPEHAVALINHAHNLGIRVKGLSFHVGSQTRSGDKYATAISRCADIIEQVTEAGLPALNTLDIGGGFPVQYTADVLPINIFCAPIRDALAQLPDTVRVIAEPGRFIVAPAVTNIASVMGQAERNGKTWYYLDDGIYGSFSGLMFDEAKYQTTSVKQSDELFPAVLAGPTCDSIDVISENIMLPKLNNGDLIVSTMMGAYCSCTATDFNFFKRAEMVVVNEHAFSESAVSA